MIGLFICLAVFCLILMFVLFKQDDKNTKLAAENGLMKGRIETLQEWGVSAGRIYPTAEAPLTVEDVETAVSRAGYVPYTSDNKVQLMVDDRQFTIDTSRLPQLLICSDGVVQTSEWDMELLKKAAHLTSDELIMVKAVFHEKPDSTILNFYIAAMDRNYLSFRANLMTYINAINVGIIRIHEIYDQLMEEKQVTTPAGTQLIDADVQDKRLPS